MLVAICFVGSDDEDIKVIPKNYTVCDNHNRVRNSKSDDEEEKHFWAKNWRQIWINPLDNSKAKDGKRNKE